MRTTGVDLVPNFETIENEVQTPKNRTLHIVQCIIKRMLDILGGIVGVIILIPITLIIYIVRKIKKEDDGSVFYEQLRIGKNGKYFKIYKYRTMVVGADEKLEEYLNENPEAREEYKKYKKLKSDPRVTQIGDFLRKTSIDELPQLINVLKGEMSLVGPRPYLPREKEEMGNSYESISSCKPGITGYWQVNGRNNLSFQERLNMDCYYVKNRNLKEDMKLLVKTVAFVVRKEGAA